MTIGNFGFLILGLLGGILALVGLLDVVRGTPVREVEAFGGGTLPGVDEPAFRVAMELLSGAQLVDGNSVEIFWNGDQTYPRLWSDLRGARRSITLQLYYNKPGRMADMLSDILVERAQAGVRVLFLYDAFGTSFKKEYLRKLRDGGVRTQSFRPITVMALNKIQHRAHIRVVCIDGEIGWTGGFGIDDKWFGNGRTKDQWRDSNARFTGPAVDQLQAAFTACWAESTGELLVFPQTAHRRPDKSIVASVLHASPSIGSTQAERFFAFSIRSARRKLYITNSYFVPDADFRRLICDAARRGVDTRILTVSHMTDVKSTWHAGRARYEQLLSAGVRVFEYQPVMMHAKTLVVDGAWSAVGSMNADNRSLSLNEETVLMMSDPDAAATVERQFLDDLAYAKEIDLASFRKRGASSRVKESVCYAFWRVL
jgi:cardiolipin synthase A/B